MSNKTHSKINNQQNKNAIFILEWEKMLANLILGKWLTSKINKEPIQLIQIANRCVKSIFQSKQIWKQSKSLATDEWIEDVTYIYTNAMEYYFIIRKKPCHLQ